ncbi:VanZ family protein [uncultured Chitinophaga sp.]|jgi:Glycopeptide antibiotics resistance protein|uniref:VanZ family protein n=1 Tax=uncultured Chitinophaga sp. TaxID=339340 RepID=UPI00262866CC|nr:VanZ family protein [uncultured Chitinophaga sp.]
MKVLKTAAVAAYFFMLIYVVFLTPLRTHRPLALQRFEHVRLVPLKGIVDDMFYPKGHQDPLTHWGNFLLNFLGNLLMFVPFSFIMIVVFRVSKTPFILAAAFLLSVVIETVQYFARLGVADVDDVLLNTFSAWIGIWLCRFTMRLLNIETTNAN